MREILFRGKRTDNGEWVEGYYMCIGGKYHYILAGKIDLTRGYTEPIKYPVDPETIGQFTGMTDMKGQKIFEGDILQAKVNEYAREDSSFWGKQKLRTGNKINAVWSVEHKVFNTYAGYMVYGKDRRFHRLLTHSVIINADCEVIGNVHDNPDLLEGE